jgi:putative spermidine/putrescine transport system ATP-binding protein
MTEASKPLAIALENCAKTFPDGTRALEPLDFAIEAGETVVFLGPSGCGKTTTLRIIAGLEEPDAGGRVLFDGEDVTHLPIEQRNVGMVFQSYALFPNMTVAGNIGYGLRIRKTPDAAVKARVTEMLGMMQITKLADRRIDQLSGGQRQRVALARAIYVTHDQAEAMALGDRIVVMEHGRVAQIGKPREIYQRPATRFVAEFIGTMNRLTGTTKDGVFACSAGNLPWAGAPPTATEILFRPEDIRVAESGEATSLQGTVAAAFFLGDRTRLFVEVGEARPLVIESTARRDFSHGEAVRLAIDPRGLLVL